MDEPKTKKQRTSLIVNGMPFCIFHVKCDSLILLTLYSSRVFIFGNI